MLRPSCSLFVLLLLLLLPQTLPYCCRVGGRWHGTLRDSAHFEGERKQKRSCRGTGSGGLQHTSLSAGRSASRSVGLPVSLPAGTRRGARGWARHGARALAHSPEQKPGRRAAVDGRARRDNTTWCPAVGGGGGDSAGAGQKTSRGGPSAARTSPRTQLSRALRVAGQHRCAPAHLSRRPRGGSRLPEDVARGPCPSLQGPAKCVSRSTITHIFYWAARQPRPDPCRGGGRERPGPVTPTPRFAAAPRSSAPDRPAAHARWGPGHTRNEPARVHLSLLARPAQAARQPRPCLPCRGLLRARVIRRTLAPSRSV